MLEFALEPDVVRFGRFPCSMADLNAPSPPYVSMYKHDSGPTTFNRSFKQFTIKNLLTHTPNHASYHEDFSLLVDHENTNKNMFQEINHHPKRIMQHEHARHYTHMHNKTANTYTKYNTKLAYTCIRDTHNMHIAKRRSNRSTMQAIFDVNYHNTCATTKRDFFRENEEMLGHGGLYEVGGRDHFLLKCTAYVRQNLLSNKFIKKAVYAAAVGPIPGGLANNNIETVAEIGHNVPMVNGVDISLDELNARLWLFKDHRTVTIATH